MVGAKQAAKRAAKEAAVESAKSGGGKGKGGKGKPQQKVRARDEIVPWGWEQAAKDERKKKNTERTQAEAAARAAKEMADLGITDKPAIKQPAPVAEGAAPAAGPADKKAAEKKK